MSAGSDGKHGDVGYAADIHDDPVFPGLRYLSGRCGMQNSVAVDGNLNVAHQVKLGQ